MCGALFPKSKFVFYMYVFDQDEGTIEKKKSVSRFEEKFKVEMGGG